MNLGPKKRQNLEVLASGPRLPGFPELYGVPGNGTCRRDLQFRVWERTCPAFALRSDLGRKGRISFCRRCGRRRRTPIGGARRRPQLG